MSMSFNGGGGTDRGPRAGHNIQLAHQDYLFEKKVKNIRDGYVQQKPIINDYRQSNSSLQTSKKS